MPKTGRSSRYWRGIFSNPGVKAQLFVREPQGINPAILQLDLHLTQEPGMWPQVMAWVQARYDRVITPMDESYSEAEIFLNGEPIARVDFDQIH